jgi:hypothetical protein
VPGHGPASCAVAGVTGPREISMAGRSVDAPAVDAPAQARNIQRTGPGEGRGASREGTVR